MRCSIETSPYQIEKKNILPSYGDDIPDRKNDGRGGGVPSNLVFSTKGLFLEEKVQAHFRSLSYHIFSYLIPRCPLPRRGIPLNLPLHDEFSSYHLLPSVLECYIFLYVQRC